MFDLNYSYIQFSLEVLLISALLDGCMLIGALQIWRYN